MEKLYVEFESDSKNEAVARIIVSGFMARLNPTLEEVSDVKTAVSEAVTNAIIHGYQQGQGIIKMKCEIEENYITIEVLDNGIGIEDIEKAKEPLFTTKASDERSGMGFAFMEIFMDELYVESKVGTGTKVIMKKKVGE